MTPAPQPTYTVHCKKCHRVVAEVIDGGAVRLIPSGGVVHPTRGVFIPCPCGERTRWNKRPTPVEDWSTNSDSSA